MCRDDGDRPPQELTGERMEPATGGPAYMTLGDIKGEAAGSRSIQITKLSVGPV